MLRAILKSNSVGAIAIAVLVCFLGTDLAFAQVPQIYVPPQGVDRTPTRSRITEPRAATTSTSVTSDGQTTIPPPQTGGDTAGTPPSVPKPSKGGGGDRWWIPVAIVGAVAVAAGVAAWLTAKSETSVADLNRDGPQFPDQFKMSAMAVVGLVQGNWPMVIDFEPGRAGAVHLYINARGAQEVFSVPLSSNQKGRRLVVLTLPPELGAEPQPAVIALVASDGTSNKNLIPLQVYALGAGPRAVGSVSIDQILFGPDRIQVSKQEKALYRFYSHSDFDNLSVEFVKVDRGSFEGDRSLINEVKIPGGVRRDTWVGKSPDGRRDWNGYNGQGQVSEGDHKLRVRVWHQAGDWIAAWSESMVTVAP